MKLSRKLSRGGRAGQLTTKWIQAFLLVCLFGAIGTHAATYTWTGTGFNGETDHKWSNPMNWAGLAAPQNGEQGVALIFPNTAAPRFTTNDVINLVISSVTFQGANYSIHGGASGITMTLAGVNGGNFVIVAAANGCQFGSSTRLHLGSTGTVAVASGNLFTIRSRISGVFGLTKTSQGTLSFQGTQANTFFGPITVLAGILDFRGVGNALPGALVIGDGDPTATPKVRLYLDDQISDTSPVTIQSNGSLELAGHDDMIGSLTLVSGNVTTIDGLNTGTLTLNGNVTNRLGSSGEASMIAGKLSLGSTTRGFWVEADSELVIAAPILGPTSGLSKSGAGRLTLSGSGNTYSGATTVQAGTLALEGPAKPGSVNNGTVVGNGAKLLLLNATVGDESLSLNGTTNTPALSFAGTNLWAGPVLVTGDCTLDRSVSGYSDDAVNFSGSISGAGSLRLIGGGTLHFTGAGNNTFSGGYYGESGLTYFDKTDSASALGGPLFVGRPEDDFPYAIVSVVAPNQIPNTALVTIRNSGALDIDQDATDTIGDVVFEGGWLIANSGVFTLSGNVTNRAATNTSAILGHIILPAGEHIFDCEWLSTLEVQGVLEGVGGVTKKGELGTLRFSNTNTYAGLTHVAEGDLVLEGKGRPGSSASGTVVDGLASLRLIHAAVTNESLTLAPFAGYSPIIWVANTNVWKGPVVLNADADIRAVYAPHLILDGPISGPGSLLYQGSWGVMPTDGTLVLAGSTANTYLGDTTVLKGTLILNKDNASAIPGNLIIGVETNGAPAASVYCQHSSQFASVAQSDLGTRRVTINPSGALHCGGFLQFIANLLTRGGGVFTEGGTIYLHNNWKTEPGGTFSYFNGKLALASPYANYTHLFTVETNATLFFVGDISQGIFVANMEKQGQGELAMISNNSFDGKLTITEGRVLASGARPFGTEIGRTIVNDGATLVTFSGTNAEPFTLSGSGYAKLGALVVQGSNYFNGPIVLGANTDIVTPGPTNLAVFAGAISGPGGLTKLGDGTVRLAGSDENTFTGVTKVKVGALELTKTNAVAIHGSLEIAVGDGDGLVRYLRDAQVRDVSPVSIGQNGQLRLLGHFDTIGSLAGSGIVELLDGSLVTGNDNTPTTYAGVISGIGGTVIKTGTNTFALTANNQYTGTTFVKGGTLLVRGQQPQSPVTIQTGGTLGGDGSVGVVSDLSGHVIPGVNSYGILHCAGYLTHAPANLLQIEINGTTPGIDQDQLDVTGSVSLMGGTLQLAMNTTGAVSNQYVIIKNSGTDPVTGSFTGLPQNSMLTNNGVVFQINYQGGDGNDVVLIQKSVAGTGAQLTSIQKLGNGTMQIGGTGVPNAVYNCEATESLASPIVWQLIGSIKANAQGAFYFEDPDAGQYSIRFYRFVLP
jgi:autotransporter-associated beta strand protein